MYSKTKMFSLDDDDNEQEQTNNEQLNNNPKTSPKRLKITTNQNQNPQESLIYQIQTTHTPPIILELSISDLKNKNIDFFLKSRNFQEGQDNVLILSHTICPSPYPWITVFNHIKDNVLSVHFDHVFETWMLYDFISDSNLTQEFINYVKDHIKNAIINDFTVSQLKNLILLTEKIDLKIDHLTVFPVGKEKQYLEFSRTMNDYYQQQEQEHQIIINRRAIGIITEDMTLNDISKNDKNEQDIITNNTPKHVTLLWDLFIRYSKSIMNIEKSIPISKTTVSAAWIQHPLMNHNDSISAYMQKNVPCWSMIQGWIDEECCWAGGSLIRAIFNLPWENKADIDLWVLSKDKIQHILQDLTRLFQDHIYIITHHSVITILIDTAHKDCPNCLIQLIYVDDDQLIYTRDDNQIVMTTHYNNDHKKSLIFRSIGDFDIDYVRCFVDGKTLWKLPECVISHWTREIKHTTDTIYQDRVDKAIKKGFTVNFSEKYQPNIIKPCRSHHNYFIPDSRLYEKDYILHMLSLVNPIEKIHTDFKTIDLGAIKGFRNFNHYDRGMLMEDFSENKHLIEFKHYTVRHRGSIKRFNWKIIKRLKNVDGLDFCHFSEEKTNRLNITQSQKQVADIYAFEENVRAMLKTHNLTDTMDKSLIYKNSYYNQQNNINPSYYPVLKAQLYSHATIINGMTNKKISVDEFKLMKIWKKYKLNVDGEVSRMFSYINFRSHHNHNDYICIFVITKIVFYPIDLCLL